MLKETTKLPRLSRTLLIASGIVGCGLLLWTAEAACSSCKNKDASVQKNKEEGKMMWMTNFEEAKKLAAKENKILLLSFSGSDWCGWCMKLDDEVFSKPAFAAWVAKNAVPVQIDFPRRSALSDALRSQNEMLARQYGVEGFPTVVLAKPDGKVIATAGYQPGGAEAYVKNLETLKGK